MLHADGQQLFTVVVAGGSSPVPATPDQLAQNFEPGERVLFRPADKRPASEASVNQTDLTHWYVTLHLVSCMLCTLTPSVALGPRSLLKSVACFELFTPSFAPFLVSLLEL